jgi:type IV fimbrial biogenesis protein FimT
VPVARDSRETTVDFVCPKTPFVGSNDTTMIPFVCLNMPSAPNRHFSAAFTLIELFVVLVVVGILSLIAFPSFEPFILNQRISGQANDLVTDLSLARSEAIKRAAPVTVCKTTDPSPTAGSPTCDGTDANPWTTGRIIFLDSGSGTLANDGNGTIDGNEQILRVRQALEGKNNRLVGDGTAAGTGNRVTFRGNGTATLTPTAGNNENQLILCDKRGGAEARAIVIGPTGRVRVADKGKDMKDNNIVCP